MTLDTEVVWRGGEYMKYIPASRGQLLWGGYFLSLLLQMLPALHAPASAEVTLTLPRHLTDSPPTVSFSTPTGSPGDALGPLPACTDQTQEAQASSSPRICNSTLLKTPQPRASMGQSLNSCVPDFQAGSREDGPLHLAFLPLSRCVRLSRCR